MQNIAVFTQFCPTSPTLPPSNSPAPPQNEHGHTWHHNASDLLEITKYGVAANSAPNYKTRMPAFENILTDQQIIAVLSFIKSQWPPAIQDQHNKIEAAVR